MATKSNPFENLTESTSTNPFESRRLAHTPMLIEKATVRASEVYTAGTKLKGKELEAWTEAGHAMVNTPDYTTTLGFISTVVTPEVIAEDSKFMSDCTEEEFSSLLESRRSDRSKLKSKGFNDAKQVRGFIAAVYAEMLVRQASGKAYAGDNQGSFDASIYIPTETDTDEVKAQKAELRERKIKSLQSKQSNLRGKTDKAETLKEVMAQIAELKAQRPNNPNVSTKVVITDDALVALREFAATIDPASLTEEQIAQFELIKQKIG